MKIFLKFIYQLRSHWASIMIWTMLQYCHKKWAEPGNLACQRFNERISPGLVVLVAVVHVSSMATSSTLVRGRGTAACLVYYCTLVQRPPLFFVFRFPFTRKRNTNRRNRKCFSQLFHFHVLYWMQTEKKAKNRGRPGNKASVLYDSVSLLHRS